MSTSIWNDFIETKQKKGDPGEFIFYEYMLSLYPDTSTHLFYFNDDGRYDLLHHNLDTHMSTTYETKTDSQVTKQTKSPNLFIEFESHGKLSGISTTQADYWVYCFYNLNQLWVISTEDLHYIIDEYRLLSKAPKRNQKGVIESWGYLIPMDACDDILKRFDIIYL